MSYSLALPRRAYASAVLLLATLLIGFAPGAFAAPCGQTGSVSERMADCAEKNPGFCEQSLEAGCSTLSIDHFVPGVAGDVMDDERISTEWRLVSVTREGRRVWWNPDLRQLWFVKRDRDLAWPTAKKLCIYDLNRFTKDSGHRLHFTLPRMTDVTAATRHGAEFVFYFLEGETFWTGDTDGRAWVPGYTIYKRKQARFVHGDEYAGTGRGIWTPGWQHAYACVAYYNGR